MVAEHRLFFLLVEAGIGSLDIVADDVAFLPIHHMSTKQ